MFLIDRALTMVLAPATAWPRLLDESIAPASMLVRYVLPLAAIGPVARFAHLVLFQDAPVWRALMEAGADFACTLAGVFIIAWSADACAKFFGGMRGGDRTVRWAAYGLTPHMLGGAFLAINFGYVLAFFAMLASLYVLGLGLGPAMQIPSNRAAGFMVLVSVAAFSVLWILPSLLGLAIGFLAA